jgi:hypothetical protein
MNGSRWSLGRVCLALAVLTLGAGGLGMLMSVLYLGSPGLEYNLAGVAGFVAGSVFVAAGLVCLTLLAVHQDRERQAGPPFVPRGQADTVEIPGGAGSQAAAPGDRPKP